MINAVQSVERIFDILETLAQAKDGWRVTELAKKLKLKTSTVHNLLRTVVYRGYVEQDNQTLKYKLGKKSFLLAQNYSTNDKLVSAAGPHLERLNRICGYLVFMGILSDADLVCLSYVESNHPLSVNPRQNWMNQCHCTAAGKILLAHCPAEELKLIVKKHGFCKFTPRTLTSFKALESELDKVRKNGYALAQDEGVPGISALGVPLRDSSSKVIAALSIAAPTAHMLPARKKQLIGELKAAACRISFDLGYQRREGSKVCGSQFTVEKKTILEKGNHHA